MKNSLYVSRSLDNITATNVIKWAKSNNINNLLAPENLHVTIAYSKTPVDWDKIKPNKFEYVFRGSKQIKFLAVSIVMTFDSPFLRTSWKKYMDASASWDWDIYIPHITLAYNGNENIDLTKITPYQGELRFLPEQMYLLDDNWENSI